MEFGTSSIFSPSVGDHVGGLPIGLALSSANPEVVFCDQTAKGYIMLTLTREQAVAELCAVSTIMAKPYQMRVIKRYSVTPQGDLAEI
nr:hypothetical protein [uncultured Brevundimonas sp.]